MKSIRNLIVLISALFASCTKDNCTKTITYEKQVAVIRSWDEIRKSPQIKGPQPLHNAGKIYLWNNYLLVNEINEGIHIYDNTNTASPQNMAFIQIQGNVDMAVRDNVLYADNYCDIVTFDFWNPALPVYKGRAENVFRLQGLLNEGIIVGYEIKLVTEEVTCEQYNVQPNMFNSAQTLSGGGGVSNSSGQTGVAGSMARFNITNSHLYAIDNSQLHTLELTNAFAPKIINSANVGGNIETLFGNRNYLFIGSQTGVFIYSIVNSPIPQYTGQFNHARVCDPVIVDEQYAYVTLRNGTVCNGFQNQLDVVDIQNMTSPQLLKTYTMQNPHGLAKLGNNMVICEGDFGFKLLDAANPNAISQLNFIAGIKTYDVIINGTMNNVIITGKGGIYQYDCTDVNNPVLKSQINIQ